MPRAHRTDTPARAPAKTTRGGMRARVGKRRPVAPSVAKAAAAAPFAAGDDLLDPDLMEDYDYSIDEHAAVDEVLAQYDEDDLLP